jgi:hypothetical protein
MIEDKGSALLSTRSNKTANIDDKSSNVQVSDTTKDARRITAGNKNFYIFFFEKACGKLYCSAYTLSNT